MLRDLQQATGSHSIPKGAGYMTLQTTEISVDATLSPINMHVNGGDWKHKCIQNI